MFENQLQEARNLLAFHFPDLFLGDFSELCEDIILGEFEAAVGADGGVDVILTPHLGARFESFLAALRAGEINDFIHV